MDHTSGDVLGVKVHWEALHPCFLHTARFSSSKASLVRVRTFERRERKKFDASKIKLRSVIHVKWEVIYPKMPGLRGVQITEMFG